MKNTMIAASMLAVASLCAMAAIAQAEDEPKYTIKEAMKQGHAGKMSLLKKVLADDAEDDEEELLLALYQSLSQQKPPKGDADSWKAKTDALVAAMQGQIDDKDGSLAALEKAANCAACHGVHKPKKE